MPSKPVYLGRAIAEEVSRWLPTAADRVPARVWSSGICGGQSGSGLGFLRVLQFPMPIFIPPNSPSAKWPGAGTIDQLATDVPREFSLDFSPYYTSKKINVLLFLILQESRVKVISAITSKTN
jgi:hypothetical protein